MATVERQHWGGVSSTDADTLEEWRRLVPQADAESTMQKMHIAPDQIQPAAEGGAGENDGS
jgi:hypothetical protein